VQHQITDTLAICINRKARLKLAEYDIQKCAQLRESILNDFGVPSIKEKILDLLTQLEKESQKAMGTFSPGGNDSNGKKSHMKKTAGFAAQEDTDELQH
jgi:hypothetical protein